MSWECMVDGPFVILLRDDRNVGLLYLDTNLSREDVSKIETILNAEMPNHEITPTRFGASLLSHAPRSAGDARGAAAAAR